MGEILLVGDPPEGRRGRLRGERAQAREKLLLERPVKKAGQDLEKAALDGLSKFANDFAIDMRALTEKSGKAALSLTPGGGEKSDAILAGARTALGLPEKISLMMTLQKDSDGKAVVAGLYIMKTDKSTATNGERPSDPILNSTGVAGFSLSTLAGRIDANSLKNPHLFVAIQPLKEYGSSLLKPDSKLQGLINMHGFQDWSSQAVPPPNVKLR